MSSGSCCAVMGCKNSWKRAKQEGVGIAFFSFPRDPALCKIWVAKCRRGGKVNVRTGRLCSDHFTKEDFEINFKSQLLGVPERKRLVKNAVPTVNLPQKYGVNRTPAAEKRRERKLQKEEKERHAELIESALVKAEENDETNDTSSDIEATTLIADEKYTPTEERCLEADETRLFDSASRVASPDSASSDRISALTQSTPLETTQPDKSCSGTQVAILDQNKLMSELMKSDVIQKAVMEALNLNKPIKSQKSCLSTRATTPIHVKLSKEINSGLKRNPLQAKKKIKVNLPCPTYEEISSESLLRDLQASEGRYNESKNTEKKGSESVEYKKLFEELKVKYQFMQHKYLNKLASTQLRGRYYYSYKKKNSKLMKANQILREKLKKVKGEMRELQSKFRKSIRLERQKLLHKVQTELEKVFTKNEIELLLSRQKFVHWTTDEYEKALKLRFLSSDAYHYVRNELKYPLPSISRLNKWVTKNPDNSLVESYSGSRVKKKNANNSLHPKSDKRSKPTQPSQGNFFLVSITNSKESSVVNIRQDSENNVEISHMTPVDFEPTCDDLQHSDTDTSQQADSNVEVIHEVVVDATLQENCHVEIKENVDTQEAEYNETTNTQGGLLLPNSGGKIISSSLNQHIIKDENNHFFNVVGQELNPSTGLIELNITPVRSLKRVNFENIDSSFIEIEEHNYSMSDVFPQHLSIHPKKIKNEM